VVKSVTAYAMVTYLPYMAFTLAILIYGTGIVLPEITSRTYTLFIVAPMLTSLFSISGNTLAAYYIAIVVAILASAAWIFLRGYKGFLSELTMKGKSRDHSVIYDLCALFFAIIFMDIVIALAMGAAGMSPGDPTESSDTWELLFALANASVWEELVVRVLLLGIPLIIVDLSRSKLREKKWSYLLGGGFTFGTPEVALVLISSMIFGVAHYDAWGAWKIFPSAVAGVAFAYMFLKHGLASAIMLHFAFDYLGMPMMVFPDSLTMTFLTGLAILVWAAFGVIMFAYFIVRIGEYLIKKPLLDEKPQVVGAPAFQPMTYRYSPPTWQYQQQTVQAPGQHQQPTHAPAAPRNGYVCQLCGSTQARWVDGKFQCMRCGNLS